MQSQQNRIVSLQEQMKLQQEQMTKQMQEAIEV